MLRTRKGFTLIELLVMIVILTILAAIAIPTVMTLFGSGGNETQQVEVITQEQELQRLKNEKAPEQEVKSTDKGKSKAL